MTANSHTPGSEDELDKIFNKPAGDGAFYLRGEIKPQLQALIDQQVTAALDAVDAALPEKRTAKYGDGMGDSYYLRSEGFNEALDQAHEAVRGVRRKNESI